MLDKYKGEGNSTKPFVTNLVGVQWIFFGFNRLSVAVFHRCVISNDVGDYCLFGLAGLLFQGIKGEISGKFQVNRAYCIEFLAKDELKSY